MATIPDTWVSYGAVSRGVWCEAHHLPHVLEYTTYLVTEYDGFPYIRPLRSVSRCDLR